MFEITHFPKAKKYWHMGNFLEWTTANVHPMSHALHYGTSVFEGIRAYRTESGPAVFRLPDHIQRLFHSAAVLRMTVPFGPEEISEAIFSTVRENSLESAYIRPLLFYSYGNLGLVPAHSPVELVIAAWEWAAYLGEKTEKGVHVFILPWRRVHYSQFDMSAKLGGLYVLSTIGGNLARDQGFDEAVYLNTEGNVAEGAGENIFVVKNGRLITNDKTESILEGITRTSILEFAGDMGLETAIRPISKLDFFEADEAFFTGTAVEVAPIVRITDGSNLHESPIEHTIGTGRAGDITLRVMTFFKEIVRGRREAYKKWLTFVPA